MIGLALLACLLAMLPDEVVANLAPPFFLLKADTTNIISQKEILGKPSYELHDWVKTGSSVDFGVSIFRYNISRVVEEVPPFVVNTDGHLHLSKLEFERGENDLSAIIVTSDSIKIYEPSIYNVETKKGLYFDWTFSNMTFERPDFSCLEVKKCTIKADSHYTIRDMIVVVVIEIRYCPKPTIPHAACSLHLGLMILNRTEEYDGKYTISRSQLINLNTTEIPGTHLNCDKQGLRAFKVSQRVTKLSDDIAIFSLIVRYCPITAEKRVEPLNMYILKLVGQTFVVENHKFASKYLLPGGEFDFKVIKVFSIGQFVIVTNRDRLLTWDIPSIFEFLTNSTKGAKPSSGIWGIAELHSDNIWCNHMNYNELSCMYLESNKSSATLSNAYKILDLVQIDGNITTVQSTGNTIFSSYNFRRVFHTKHYILINAINHKNNPHAYICDKRISTLQSVGGNKKDAFTRCLKLELKSKHRPATFSNLLFDDNYNNELNGYLLVAYTEISGLQSTKRIIQPLLLSGPYFEIVPNVDLTNQLCHRYMEYCAQFDLVFRSSANDTGTQRSFYILNQNFSSILPKLNLKEYFSGSMYSSMTLKVDDYFLGDLQNLKISSLQEVYSPRTQGVYRPLSQTESTVEKPLKFTFLFPRETYLTNMGKQFILEWCLVRLLDNKPISLSFGLLATQSLTPKKIRKFSLFRTLPNLEYSTNEAIVSEKYLALNTMLVQEQPAMHFLLTYRNSEPSTVTMLKVNYSDPKNVTRQYMNLSLEVYGGKKSKDKNFYVEAIVRFDLRIGERVQSVRSPLDSSLDLFAVITPLRFIIFQIKTEDDGNTKLKEVKNFLLTKFKFAEPPGQSLLKVQALDVLYFQNLLILDVNLTIRDIVRKVDQSCHRIYIFFMNPLLDSYYKLGYIDLDPKESNYFLYYYHVENKALLILPNKKQVREYVIDNVKLDIRKIGKEILPSNTIKLNNYGSYKILEMYHPRIQDSVLHNRTLGAPTFEGYFILLVRASEDKEVVNLALLANITDHPLLFFKSHLINLHQKGCQLNVPSVIFDDYSEVVPIVELCHGSRILNVHMLWLENKIDLCQHYQLSHADNSDHNHLKLNLNFEDVGNKEYEETFLIGKSHRYHIQANLKTSLMVTEDKSHLSLSKIGLVNSISFECSSGSTEAIISRNNLPIINCVGEKYIVKALPAIRKESFLAFNPYLMSRIKDFKRIPVGNMQPLKGLFTLLLNDTIVIFSSKSEELKPLLWANLRLSEDELFDCISIKAIRMAVNQSDTYKIHFFCTIGFHLKEVIFGLPWGDLNEVANTHAKQLTLARDNVTIFEVPMRLRNSVVMGHNNIRSIDDLLFVVGKKTLWSYGERLAMDIYKIREPKDNQTQRFLLLNSSISEKTDKWKLLAFKIMRFKYTDQYVNPKLKYYELLRLSSHTSNDYMRLVYCILRYDDIQLEIDSKNEIIEFKTYLPKVTNEFDFISIIAEVGPQKYSGVEDEEWREHLTEHQIFGIVDNVIYQYTIGNLTKGFENRVWRDNLHPIKYDFSGICASNSEYSIETSAKFIILSCVPEYSEHIPSYIIVFEKRSIDHSKNLASQSFYPLQVMRLEIGLKTSSEGLVKLIVGSDGSHRILKASKRTIITQYVLEGEPKLEITADPTSWSPRQLNLEMSNYFEKKTVSVLMTTNKVRYFAQHLKFITEDPALLVVVVVYLLVMLFFLSGLHYFARSFMSGDKTKDNYQITAKPLRVSKRELAQRLLTDAF